jgi:hypothetical protein
MVLVLGIGLGGLAVAAVGVAHQMLPRQFTTAQQRRIMTWEVARRWRSVPAGAIFPATVGYKVPAGAVNSSQNLPLTARRLGISRQSDCEAGVSRQAATVLSAGRCSAVLRATYLDSSGSMVVTVGVAVLPDLQAAQTAARKLAAHGQELALSVQALPVAGTAASGFGNRQRQLSEVVDAGPYVVLSTAGFADGRHHVRLASDYYYDQEMTSLADGLAQATGSRLDAPVSVPRCPGAPGC